MLESIDARSCESSGNATSGIVGVEIKSLCLKFGSGARATQAVEDLSLIARREEVTCILGPSGCGKSTLLKVVAGFIHPDRGVVRVGEKNVENPGRDRVMVFQAPVLLPWRTVFENVSFALQRQSTESHNLVHEILESVGLTDFKDHYTYQLSGGMKQRAQIARALVMQPAVLLLDEPFGALDAQTRIHMQRLLQDLVLKYKPTILFVTHDVEEALFVADRIFVMTARPGRVREEIQVPWPRPRDTSVLEEPEFGHLNAHILRLLGL